MHGLRNSHRVPSCPNSNGGYLREEKAPSGEGSITRRVGSECRLDVSLPRMFATATPHRARESSIQAVAKNILPMTSKCSITYALFPGAGYSDKAFSFSGFHTHSVASIPGYIPKSGRSHARYRRKHTGRSSVGETACLRYVPKHTCVSIGAGTTL